MLETGRAVKITQVFQIYLKYLPSLNFPHTRSKTFFFKKGTVFVARFVSTCSLTERGSMQISAKMLTSIFSFLKALMKMKFKVHGHTHTPFPKGQAVFLKTFPPPYLILCKCKMLGRRIYG